MKISKDCAICNKKLKNFLDLGAHPCADSFLKKKNSAKKLKKYPLIVGYCTCNHLTAVYKVSSFERYKKNDYSYTSDNSKVSRAHFENMAKQITKEFRINKDSKIIEIGSNDGTFLKNIEKYSGAQVLGIDPADFISKQAKKKGLASLNVFFDIKNAKNISDDFGKFDILYGANVFNHIESPKNFLNACKKVLKSNGTIILEVPDLNSLLNEGGFDTIYHEHRQYFSIESLRKVFNSVNLKIYKFQKISYMSGSLRIFSKNIEKKTVNISKKFNYDRFNKFKTKIPKIKENILNFIENNKVKNKAIVCLGAATKGNTLLNYCKLNDKNIKYIYDVTPEKINKYAPGSGIKVIKERKIKKNEAVIILPWNITNYLHKKLLHKNHISYTSISKIIKKLK